jgi:PAS domain S-box-containing protein
MKLSLTKKGLILISVPLLFQLIFASALVFLRNQAEADARLSEHAQAVSDTLNKLVRDLFDIVSLAEGGDPSQFGLETGLYKRATDNIITEFQNLRELVKDNPRQKDIVDHSYVYASQMIAVMHKVEDAYTNGSTFELLRVYGSVRPQLKVCIKNVLSRDLISLSEESTALAAKESHQSKFRTHLNQLLMLAITLNLIVTILLALYFTREITGRIKVISENSVRLANNKKLLDPIGGTDEIAALDQVFHDTARSLEETAQKERAILENAADVIFSINSKGTFLNINPAAQIVLGYTPQELTGAKYVTLIPEDSKEATLAYVKRLMDGAAPKLFETKMRRKDGSIIDVVWAAQWSASQKSIFCVAHDVTARKAVDRLRQEVMAMVSHDLRTPLATIGNVLTILEEGRVGELPERGVELVTMAQRNVQRMLGLVNDLLEVEKMKAGMLKLELDETELSDVFEDALHSVQGWAQEHKVRIEYVPTTLKVYADESRLVQVLTNLLGNAVKFSPAGKRVLLSALEGLDYVEVIVKDEGRGIPEDQREMIFERFQQVRAGDSANHGGTGLGLAICKAIVERHGGTIRVESEEGFGSTFAFRLPKNKDQVPTLQLQSLQV